jgi:hypothetical protein
MRNKLKNMISPMDVILFILLSVWGIIIVVPFINALAISFTFFLP